MTDLPSSEYGPRVEPTKPPASKPSIPARILGWAMILMPVAFLIGNPVMAILAIPLLLISFLIGSFVLCVSAPRRD